MEENNKNVDHNFVGLVVSLSASAWQHLGKIQNPVTNKVDKNLEAAKMTIDLLEMLETKTKGNLSDSEKKFLDNSLADLRLNYVEELKSGDTPNPSEPEKPPEEKQVDK